MRSVSVIKRNLFLEIARVSDLLELNKIMDECKSKKSLKILERNQSVLVENIYILVNSYQITQIDLVG